MTNAQLKAQFLEQLNRAYCVKSHLMERFSEFNGYGKLQDIEYWIIEACRHAELQVIQMEKIFALLKSNYSFENCHDQINYVENAFNEIFQNHQDRFRQDLSVLFYVHAIESMEQGALQLLDIIALKINQPEIILLVKQLKNQSQSGAKLANQLIQIHSKK